MLYNSFLNEKTAAAEFWQHINDNSPSSSSTSSSSSSMPNQKLQANGTEETGVSSKAHRQDKLFRQNPSAQFDKNTAAALQSAALLHHLQQQQQTELMNQQSLLSAQEYLFQLSRENPLFLAELLNFRNQSLGSPASLSNTPPAAPFMSMPSNFQMLQKAAMAAAANSLLAGNAKDLKHHSESEFDPNGSSKKHKFNRHESALNQHNIPQNVSENRPKSSLQNQSSPNSSVSSSSPNGLHQTNPEEAARLSLKQSNNLSLASNSMKSAVKRPYLKFSMDSILSGGETKSNSSSSSSSEYNAYQQPGSPDLNAKKPCLESRHAPIKREFQEHLIPQSSSTNLPHHSLSQQQQQQYRIQLNYANMINPNLALKSGSSSETVNSANGTVSPAFTNANHITNSQLYGLGKLLADFLEVLLLLI
jgi:hypothetical protein